MSDETKSKKILTAAEILESDDIKTIEVDVPEWGGVILLKSLRGDEANDYWEANKKDKDKDNAIPRMLARSIVDQQGKLIFTEADVVKLKVKALAPMRRIQNAFLTLNGLDEKAEEETKNA